MEVPEDGNAFPKVRQIVGDVNAVDSDFEVPDQRIDISRVLQDQFPDVGNLIRGVSLLVVCPEVEAARVEAVLDQGVVTVTLEVVLLPVKGHVVRIAPYLTIAWS